MHYSRGCGASFRRKISGSSHIVMWTFLEKVDKNWKKMLRQSGKIAFVFSIVIEMLQLLLRLGTFQLSDIFYNTVGGVVGGFIYYAVVKIKGCLVGKAQ